jgi:nucleoside 2-deoxyribosyltransferase
MKTYIAAPLFNESQIEIISSIEQILSSRGIDYYSPRIHSGSHLMNDEDRKNTDAWKAVFDSNVKALYDCEIMIAVLEYAMPKDRCLALICWYMAGKYRMYMREWKEIELPDTGTVWEMGLFKALNKPVIGYHTNEAKQMNLMLTHSCEGFIKGLDQLEKFVRIDTSYPEHQLKRYFDMDMLSEWDTKNKGVE